MSYDITNKTILITGANRGIGRAIVETFIKQGAAKIYAAVRNVQSVEPLVATYSLPYSFRTFITILINFIY